MKRDKDDSSEPQRIGCATGVGRFVLTVFGLTAVAYVAILLIGRTEGFQEMASARLQRVSGLELSIAGAELNHGLAIVYTDVRYAPEGDSPTPVRIDMERLVLGLRPRFGPWPRLAVSTATAEGVAIDFVESSGRAVAPPELIPLHVLLHEWADWEQVGSVESERVLDGILAAQVHWRIAADSIRWLAADGMVLREISDLSLEITPLKTASVKFNYCDVKMRMRTGRRPFEELELERIILINDD